MTRRSLGLFIDDGVEKEREIIRRERSLRRRAYSSDKVESLRKKSRSKERKKGTQREHANVPKHGMMQWHPGGANLSNLPHVAMTPLCVREGERENSLESARAFLNDQSDPKIQLE